MSWNFGDILDGVEAVLPSDAPALCHADRRITWGELSRLSNNLAASLVARGARPGDRIAFYLRNRPVDAATVVVTDTFANADVADARRQARRALRGTCRATRRAPPF